MSVIIILFALQVLSSSSIATWLLGVEITQ
jgi:hypothetical protein